MIIPTGNIVIIPKDMKPYIYICGIVVKICSNFCHARVGMDDVILTIAENASQTYMAGRSGQKSGINALTLIRFLP